MKAQGVLTTGYYPGGYVRQELNSNVQGTTTTPSRFTAVTPVPLLQSFSLPQTYRSPQKAISQQ